MGKRFKTVVLSLLILAASTAFLAVRFLSSPPPVSSVEILAGPIQPLITVRDKWESTLSDVTTNAAIWRAHYALFGQKPPVNVYGGIYNLKTPALELFRTNHIGARATFMLPEGIRFSFLPQAEMQQLQKQLSMEDGCELQGNIRISSIDGIKSSMFIGQSMPVNGGMVDVGQSLECITKTWKKSSDLLLQLHLTEIAPNNDPIAAQQPTVQTNLALSVKLGIPRNHGIVIHRELKTEPEGKAILILLEPLK